MATTRRQFIKRTVGAVTVSMFMPQFLLRDARGQDGLGDRKLVKIFMLGGNDGLNTVVPYTDPRYYELRPTIGLKEADLKDSQGRSTIISDRLGLHPALSSLKTLFDGGKVAIVSGVGSAIPSLSHFSMMDQLHTGDPTGRRRDGWLGRYLKVKFPGGTSAVIPAMSLKSQFAPRAFRPVVDAPNIPSFANYGPESDPLFPGEQRDVLKALESATRAPLVRRSVRRIQPGCEERNLERTKDQVDNRQLQLLGCVPCWLVDCGCFEDGRTGDDRDSRGQPVLR
jgi:hypothetical protein